MPPRRYLRWILIFLLSGSFWLGKKLVDFYNSLPPLYSQYHWQEMALPQHSEHLPYPDDDARKFLWMSDHVRGYGKWFFVEGLSCNHNFCIAARVQVQVGGMSCRSISWMDIFPTSQSDRERLPHTLRPPIYPCCKDLCSIITRGTLARYRIRTGETTSSHHVFHCPH